jgi:hypothetical protein
MVTAEKNTNPFANGNVQNVCGDASLPVTPELRGITPLIDPDVDVNGDAAALSQSSAASPLAADGLSVFDLMDQAGLGDLVVSQAASGGAAAGGAAQGGNQAAAGNGNAGNAGNDAGNNAGNQNAANNGNNNNNQQQQGSAASNATADAGNNNANAGNNNANAGNNNANSCNNNAGNANNQNNAGNDNAANNQNNNANAGNDNAGNDNAANNQNDNQNNNNAGNNAGNNQQDAAAGNNNNANAGADAGNAAGNAAGAGAGGEDFGLCTPTITFQGGENGRAADEFTFQIADPLARGGQGEALNPDIITNALCNQLTNVCEANDAAVATCESAAAAVKGGDRNKALADQFNSLIGFPGAVTNPDGGPEDVPAAGAGAAGAAKARKMRRGLRM